MEIFYAMREELQFCLKRIQLLEVVLTDNGIPVPDYEDCSLFLLATSAGRAYYWRSLPARWRKISGRVVDFLHARGGFAPVYAPLVVQV